MWKPYSGYVTTLPGSFSLFELKTSFRNARSFLEGSFFCDSLLINKDETFKKLLEPCSKEVDKMTRWCVELIFAGLEVATRRMLHDHTKQGRFDSADDQELVSETSSVATINVESERFCNAWQAHEMETEYLGFCLWGNPSVCQK